MRCWNYLFEMQRPKIDKKNGRTETATITCEIASAGQKDSTRRIQTGSAHTCTCTDTNAHLDICAHLYVGTHAHACTIYHAPFFSHVL